MATEIVMPRLGWTMEEGILNEWIKHDGDFVQAGEIIFTVESDKAVNEVEAFESGVLRIPPDSPPLGTTLKVGALLAYIVPSGESAPFESSQNAVQSPAPVVSEVKPASALSTQHSSLIPHHSSRITPTISPRARRIALELGVDWETVKGSGRTGRIVERDIRAAASHAETVEKAAALTPVARRVAADLGVDVNMLAATSGKRIRREDVEASLSKDAAPVRSSDTVEPVSHMRRLIGQRMAESAHTTASVTLTTEADATELVRLRKQLKADTAANALVPSYNDLLVRLLATALSEHPLLNARLEGDAIHYSAGVHVGVAVDTPRGLLVPVLRDVQGKSVRQIAAESAELVETARAGKLSAAMMSGGSFSLTNLGMYEIDAFTPIINLPECAILGVGRIVAKQVVIDAEAETLAIRHMMFMSLTFDHRLVDGAPAARFLQRVRQLVQQPYLWLVG